MNNPTQFDLKILELESNLMGYNQLSVIARVHIKRLEEVLVKNNCPDIDFKGIDFHLYFLSSTEKKQFIINAFSPSGVFMSTPWEECSDNTVLQVYSALDDIFERINKHLNKHSKEVHLKQHENQKEL